MYLSSKSRTNIDPVFLNCRANSLTLWSSLESALSRADDISVAKLVTYLFANHVLETVDFSIRNPDAEAVYLIPIVKPLSNSTTDDRGANRKM